MATFSYELGRRKIYFSDHALSRWWDRCQENEVLGRKQSQELLRERLEHAYWERYIPPWARLSLFHRARVEGLVFLDDESGFVVNKNPNGDLVAVTYLEEGLQDTKYS